MALFVALAAGFTFFLTLLLLVMPLAPAREREVERMLAIVRSTRQDRRRISAPERIRTLVLRQVGSLGNMVGMSHSPKLQRRLQRAGLRSTQSGEYFIAAQSLSLLAGAALGSFISVNTFFWVIGGAVLGFMTPDFWLSAKVDRRRERMRRSVPDAIDLLVICVNAGLGLDQAQLRVGEELGISHPDLSDEFNRLKLERQAGKPRPEAWHELADRTRVEELKTFATILSETDRFGTPISDALRDFAEEVRTKRRQSAEELAAKTKIKIIFPLVLCIFPCILIVLLGPAILSILNTLGDMQH